MAKAEGNGNLILWNNVFAVADSSNRQDPHRMVVASPPIHRMVAAATTAHESVAPFLVRQILFTRFFADELLHEINDCQYLYHGRLDLMLQNKTPTSQPIYDVRTNPLIRKKIK